MTIQFWTNDPTVLFNKEYIFELWPTSEMCYEQKLNAIQQARGNGTEEIAIEFFNQLLNSQKGRNLFYRIT